MPTNEERREVAARLRDIDTSNCYTSLDVLRAIEDACGCNVGKDWQDMVELKDQLADLIEPEPERTCNNSYVGGCTVAFKCSACGESCFYPKKGNGKYVKPRYCPNCGAKVVI